MRYGSDTRVPVVQLQNSVSHGTSGSTMSKSGATKRYCYGNTVMTLVYRLSNAIVLYYKISHTLMTLGCHLSDKGIL